MKNTTTLQSKRSITVLLGVLLYFSSLSAQTMQDTKEFLKKSCTSIWTSLFTEPEKRYGSKVIW